MDNAIAQTGIPIAPPPPSGGLAALAAMPEEARPEVVHQAGERNLDALHESYRKAGVKMSEFKYVVDQTGTISKLLEAPEKSIGATCELEFTTAAGEERTVQFRLKFRNLEKRQQKEEEKQEKEQPEDSDSK